MSCLELLALLEETMGANKSHAPTGVQQLVDQNSRELPRSGIDHLLKL